MSTLAASARPAVVSIGVPNAIQTDCVQVGGILLFVLTLNGVEALSATDTVAPGRPATFGGAQVGIAGGSVGFRAAVTNLRVSELRVAP